MNKEHATYKFLKSAVANAMFENLSHDVNDEIAALRLIADNLEDCLNKSRSLIDGSK